MNKLKILFLAANPAGTDPLALDAEVREIELRILTSDHRDSLELISKWAVRPEDLLLHLQRHRPHIVHFSGHGSPEDEIILQDRDGQAKPVAGAALAHLFQTLKDNIRLVVLNACFSRSQAEAITRHVDCAVGMNQSVSDAAAFQFAAAFYQALGFGQSVQTAFELGRTALMLEGIPEHQTPELLVRQGVDPSIVVLAGPAAAQDPAPTDPNRPLDLVYSYSRKDRKLRETLDTHLALLQKQGHLTTWHDREIVPGGEWQGQISEHFENADIILLLISASFIASDYCYDIEMKRSMERHEAGEARVIPVLLRPVELTGTPFMKLAGLPSNGVPVTKWPVRDEAWADIARGIRRVVEYLRQSGRS